MTWMNFSQLVLQPRRPILWTRWLSLKLMDRWKLRQPLVAFATRYLHRNTFRLAYLMVWTKFTQPLPTQDRDLSRIVILWAPLRGAPPCKLFPNRLGFMIRFDRNKPRRNICTVKNLTISVFLDWETTTTDCTWLCVNHTKTWFFTKKRQIDMFLYHMEFFSATSEACCYQLMCLPQTFKT